MIHTYKADGWEKYVMDPQGTPFPDMEPIEREIEVVDEENVQTQEDDNASKISSDNNKNGANDPEPPIDDEGQTLLF